TSGGLIKENIQHTSDATLKQIHSFIDILNSDIAQNMDASFITMKKSLAIGIQLVKTTITLATVSLNGNGNGYVYEEIETCDIPTCYKNRTRWLRVFDLMSNLMGILKEHNIIYDKLKAEHNGVIEVDEDMTIRAKL
ncbi:hypothetical protein K501DRAFT_136435, partial [Backusella circina FSU 941]